MRFQSWQPLLALPIAAVAYGPATVYLGPAPAPEIPLNIPSLSPYEANAVLATFVDMDRILWSDMLDETIDFGKKEWDYLFHSIHPREEAIGAGQPDVLMLLLHSDHPQGDSYPRILRYLIAHFPLLLL